MKVRLFIDLQDAELSCYVIRIRMRLFLRLLSYEITFSQPPHDARRHLCMVIRLIGHPAISQRYLRTVLYI